MGTLKINALQVSKCPLVLHAKTFFRVIGVDFLREKK